MLDKKYNGQEKEAKWLKYWQDEEVYKFVPDKREVFSIDTTPPTLIGNIHICLIFSFSQT